VISLPGVPERDVDRGRCACPKPAVENRLELPVPLNFENHFVHAAAGHDQRGRDDGERAALLDVARGAEETFFGCSALASTPPVSTLPDDGTTAL
jgi:hypothetical protein